MEDRTLLTAFLVTNTSDSGSGSLRQAILDANAAKESDDAIKFAIPGAGIQTITPESPLPPISRAVMIDGTSQPNYHDNPLIEINGSLAGASTGLTITGSGATVRGLAIDGFASGAAILIKGPTASHNAVYGNQLGSNAGGHMAAGNFYGVEISNGAHDNDVGSTSPAGANDIAGNTAGGVLLNTAPIDAVLGFAAAAGSLTLNGSATIEANQLRLADNFASTSASAFTSHRVDVTRFNTEFTFQLGRYSEGLTFTIQGHAPTALGSALGYVGLQESVSVTFYTGSTLQGYDTTGMFLDGADPRPVGSLNLAGYGIDLTSDDVFQADLSYDGQGLAVTITDTATGASARQVYSVDIPGAVGSQTAYVGFTAGTDYPGYDAPSLPAILTWRYMASAGVTGNRVAGNAITGNGGAGIAIVGSNSSGNAIRANTISGNTGLAIDSGALATSVLPSAPVIINTARGGIEGWLHESSPDAGYHLDFFASSSYSGDGSGQAQQFLGSLDVTTDSHGDALFDVPFTPPEYLPVVTATATDEHGNTSALPRLRSGRIAANLLGFRFSSGQVLSFSGSTGAGLALEDPQAGPLESTWSVTVSVPVGSLSFQPGTATTGVGTLQVGGTLSVINAVLAHLLWIPPPGLHGTTTVSVIAESPGAFPIQSTFNMTDGVFIVRSVADSGPGTLRQAILDSSAARGSNTIAFALPGAGIQTIALDSPLPRAMTPTLIDGATQPGFSGTPLVGLADASGGLGGVSALGSLLCGVRGLAVDGYVFGSDGVPESLTFEYAAMPGGNSGHASSYPINLVSDGHFVVSVVGQGLALRLTLRDSQNHVLVESDGPEPAGLGGLIDQNLPAGSYDLYVEIISGAGDYQLKAAFAPTASKYEGQTVASGDFNGDGILDFVASDGIHLGVGDGTFAGSTSGLGLPAHDSYQIASRTIYVGDYNGDGKLDVLMDEFYFDVFAGPAAINNNLLIVLGNADGTFQPATYVIGHFGTFGSVVTGDFSNDGKTDVAYASGSQVSVLVSSGDGNFRSPETYQPSSASGIITRLVTGDFNGDGKLDLAALADGSFLVSLGNGDGTFRPTVATSVPSYSDVALLDANDFDGDGKTDIAVSYANGNAILVFRGDGDGTFFDPDHYLLPTAANTIRSGDYNGDGHLDLVIWGYPRSNDQTNFTLQFESFLAGNGDGSFQAPRTIGQNSDLQVANPLVGDFNNDGKLDRFEPHLSTSQFQATNYAFVPGNGDGTFEAKAVDPTSTIPSLVATGDFDGDGRIDMAVASDLLKSITILLGDGQGGYVVGAQISSGTVGTISCADINGDGRLDLVTDLGVLLGNGDGTFQASFSATPPANRVPALSVFDAILPGFDASSVQSGDFNGDGKLDAAVSGTIAQSSGVFSFLPGVVVFLNDSAGGFSPSQSFLFYQPNEPYDTGSRFLGSGDFNGDGKLDLAVIRPYTPPLAVSLYLGNGDGTFAPPVAELLTSRPDQYGYSPSVSTANILLGDSTGDGKLDLITWDVDNRFFLLDGNGDGSFQPAQIVPTATSFSGVYISDLNGDGRPDLILPNSTDGTISTLLNNGDGTFSTAGQLITDAQATPLVADLNGDGAADVLVVDGNGNILFRAGNRLAPGSFLPPAVINFGSPSRALAWVAKSMVGPLLASVDAERDAISLYAFRNGGFIRCGSLPTGRLPAQIFAADLNHDGWDDLVLRCAGYGSVLTFLNNGPGSFSTGFDNPFRPPVTTVVGEGVSSIELIDTTGSGSLDLVVTDALSGQVSVLLNRGNGGFGFPVTYRAGTNPSAVVTSSGSLHVTSLESTVDVAGGRLTPGSPISLITANPGSSTLDVLQGSGGGRFSNPVIAASSLKASAIRSWDFNHDGVLDLAVLDDHGIGVLLGDGKGGFFSPARYDAGPHPTGLLIADVNGNGTADLIIGNPYGDVLVLLNQGNGTFAPYQKADQSVALAVADLKGDGSKDVIYADQGLDRVIVDYGGGSSAVLGDRSSGLLSPGAVKLADLNGDGIPDLIVANSGSNNVLIYPGLGNGQFGSASNGGHGFFTGTNPSGLDVADLNDDGILDLVVANAGSNDVSVLLGQGTGAAWTMFAGPRIKTDSGPVAVAVGSLLGTGGLDLAVANQQANNVQVFPGVGNGFFNDTAPVTYGVGQAPSGLFLGNFTGSGTSIATLNAGSNTISLIGAGGVIQTLSAGGLRPTSGFAGDFGGNGFTDLVVGNSGDGRFALFTGGPGALSLSQTIASADAPSPTSLSFAGITDGVLSFYASTAGRETASLLAFNLELGASTGGSLTGEGLASGSDQSTGSVLASATAGLFQQVAQFLNLNGSSLDLLAPLFTVSVIPGEFEQGSIDEGGVALLASFLPSTGSATLGQSLRFARDGTESDGVLDARTSAEFASEKTNEDGSMLPPWASTAMALEKAWDQIRFGVLEKGGVSREAADRAISAPRSAVPVNPAPEKSPRRSESPHSGAPGAAGAKALTAPGSAWYRNDSAPRAPATQTVIDAATENLVAENDREWQPSRSHSGSALEPVVARHERVRGPTVADVVVASATTIAALGMTYRFRRRRARGIPSHFSRVEGTS
jgi:parallel beta-helix repeat protein